MINGLKDEWNVLEWMYVVRAWSRRSGDDDD